jgi:hypothetical protein
MITLPERPDARHENPLVSDKRHYRHARVIGNHIQGGEIHKLYGAGENRGDALCRIGEDVSIYGAVCRGVCGAVEVFLGINNKDARNNSFRDEEGFLSGAILT